MGWFETKTRSLTAGGKTINIFAAGEISTSGTKPVLTKGDLI